MLAGAELETWRALFRAELGDRPGRRNALELDAVRELARAPAVRAIVNAVLGERARAVRALLFDKAPRVNWPVAWHRDRTVALAGRAEVQGLSGWSEKAGVLHAHAPRSVLDGMLTVRVHVDPSERANGALRVAPGSHRDPGDESREPRRAVVVEAPAGAAVLMRPRLLHASGRSAEPERRRTVHLEFARSILPAPLRWRWWV